MAGPINVLLQAGYWAPFKRRSLGVHTNPGLEIVYVRKGTLYWQADSCVEKVPPESVFFTLPWQRHGSVRETEPGCELFFAVIALDKFYRLPTRRFKFHPAIGMSSDVTARLCRTLTESRHHTYTATPGISHMLPRLVDEFCDKAFAKSEYLAALTRCVVLELGRILNDPIRARHVRTDDAQKRVMKFVEELGQRCSEPWTIDSMARASGVKRTRFAEILAERTGDTPIMALNRARIERARILLRQHHRTVTSIALEVGFTTSQYFARVFKDYTGITPSAYRRHRTKLPQSPL